MTIKLLDNIYGDNNQYNTLGAVTTKPLDSTFNSELFDLALKFANDCGTEALEGRDFDKMEQFYKDFATKAEQLYQSKVQQTNVEARHEAIASYKKFNAFHEREARINEIDRIANLEIKVNANKVNELKKYLKKRKDELKAKGEDNG